MTTTPEHRDITTLDPYQSRVAGYWNERRPDNDQVNLALGDIDGLYHHHYGLGGYEPAVLQASGDAQHQLIISELHRLETAQADYLLNHLGGLSSDDRILDAGCGRGASSFLAHRRFGCAVDGVSISAAQIEFAHQQAVDRWGCTDAVHFHLRDMLNTGFPDDRYQAVWTNETTMYVDLNELFAEFARLLAPGGRYVCITGAHNDTWGETVSPAVARINERYLCRVHHRSRYFRALAANGLVPITVENLTPKTMPYWELRNLSPVKTGVEDDFLTAYSEGSFHYLLIVADRV